MKHRIVNAIVLAGGAGQRLGGLDKGSLVIEGRRLLDRVLDAVTSVANHVVVVAPEREIDVDKPVIWTMEDPPGGGPLAGFEAGVAALVAKVENSALNDAWVLTLACDLPFADQAIGPLLHALDNSADTLPDAFIGVDETGHEQQLLALYRVQAVQKSLARMGPTPGQSMRSMLETLVLAAVTIPGEASRDVDTPADAASLNIDLSTGLTTHEARGDECAPTTTKDG